MKGVHYDIHYDEDIMTSILLTWNPLTCIVTEEKSSSLVVPDMEGGGDARPDVIDILDDDGKEESITSLLQSRLLRYFVHHWGRTGCSYAMELSS